MKNTKLYLLLLLIVVSACKERNEETFFLENEEKTIRVLVGTDQNSDLIYEVFHKGQEVLDTSYLGLTTTTADFSQNLTITGIEGPGQVVDNYSLAHGKLQQIKYKAQQYILKLQNKEGMPFECQFNLSKNGVAFRYLLPEGDTIQVLQEKSTFNFPSNTKAWMQPMSKAKTGWRETNPSYEEHYQVAVPVSHPSPIGEGYVYPALFNQDSSWLLISEANLHERYCGTHLKYDDRLGQLRITMPQPAEVFPGDALLPNGAAPFATPWRTIAIGSLKDIVSNTLGTDLAAPSIGVEEGFIKPGLSSWSWVLLKDNFTNYTTSKQFIDYAAEMNWPYCLIDADWDQKIGYEKMQELIDYARTQEVGILLWYNSSGSWNSTTYSPKSKLVDPRSRKAEFARLQKMGVAGCKVDFFGGDGQSMIKYYHDILRDAAAHKLLLNFHGATLPRGWHRTYPNLMTVEAIKGQEFITFEQQNADVQPKHCTIIPFTRNVYDPMDFTPMVLDEIPNIYRVTTATFELALPVLFTSGIQHIAEIPAGMAKMPEAVVEYLKDIPVSWNEVRLISGYPGKDLVLARRKNKTWFIVGINGEQKLKIFNLDLSFVNASKGIIFQDGEKRNEIVSSGITRGKGYRIEVKAYGGFVIKI